MSEIKEDFPEPETPETTTNFPSGIFTSIFLRLCSDAPLMKRFVAPEKKSDFKEGAVALTSLFPLKYSPVKVLAFSNSRCSPSKITFPPCLPDRKSTRLNSSHSQISYAVFCLQKHTPQVATHRQVGDLPSWIHHPALSRRY